jgi:hypothetical protein
MYRIIAPNLVQNYHCVDMVENFLDSMIQSSHCSGVGRCPSSRFCQKQDHGCHGSYKVVPFMQRASSEVFLTHVTPKAGSEDLLASRFSLLATSSRSLSCDLINLPPIDVIVTLY